MWYGFNFTGQTIIVMRSLRVLISGSALMFQEVFPKSFLQLSLALLGALIGQFKCKVPSAQGASTCPTGCTPRGALCPQPPPSLSGISPGQTRVWGSGGFTGALEAHSQEDTWSCRGGKPLSWDFSLLEEKLSDVEIRKPCMWGHGSVIGMQTDMRKSPLQ